MGSKPTTIRGWGCIVLVGRRQMARNANPTYNENGEFLCRIDGCENVAEERSSYCSQECREQNHEATDMTDLFN